MAIIFQVKVQSSQPRKNPEGYTVTRYGTGWDCTCSGWGYRHDCRHQRNVEQNYQVLRLHRNVELQKYQHERGWITEEEWEQAELNRKVEEEHREASGLILPLNDLVQNARRQLFGTPDEQQEAHTQVEHWRQNFRG